MEMRILETSVQNSVPHPIQSKRYMVGAPEGETARDPHRYNSNCQMAIGGGGGGLGFALSARLPVVSYPAWVGTTWPPHMRTRAALGHSATGPRSARALGLPSASTLKKGTGLLGHL